MKAEMLNIRAFKVILPDGEIFFEHKSKDGRGSMSCGSIKSLAYNVISDAKDFFKENSFAQVTIDLKPYHDIEIPSDLAPRRCLPLTEKELEEFWKHYCSL